MKIAIIIPTYNPDKYIFECFMSLENQVGFIPEFYVVVILNGERDPFYGEIKSYLNNSKLNFKLIYTKDSGVSNARNLGLKFVKDVHFDYVFFLDDDDKLSPSVISDCAKIANPHHIVLCNTKTFTNNSNNLYGDDYISKCFNKNLNKKFNSFSYRCFFSSMCAKLIPLNIIGETKFNCDINKGEDSLFGMEIFKKHCYCILSNIDTIYYRRLRDNSTSRKKQSKSQSINNNLKLIREYSRIFFGHPSDYNICFYFSRIIAEVKCIIFKVFEK